MKSCAALSIRIPAEFKAQLESVAKRNRRSVTQEVLRAIQRHAMAAPGELWVNEYPDVDEPCAYFTREEAIEYGDGKAGRLAVLYREVIE